MLILAHTFSIHTSFQSLFYFPSWILEVADFRQTRWLRLGAFQFRKEQELFNCASFFFFLPSAVVFWGYNRWCKVLWAVVWPWHRSGSETKWRCGLSPRKNEYFGYYQQHAAMTSGYPSAGHGYCIGSCCPQVFSLSVFQRASKVHSLQKAFSFAEWRAASSFENQKGESWLNS